MPSDTAVLTTKPCAAWKSAHEPVEGVPRWARIAAYTIAFLVLPSSIWRIALVTFHVPLVDVDDLGNDPNGDVPGWLPGEVYVVLLSVASELLAFTAVGLIARWGRCSRAGFPSSGAVECRSAWSLCPQCSVRSFSPCSGHGG